MIDKKLLYKITSAFCLAALFTFNAYAQQLASTDWVSITKMRNSMISTTASHRL